MSDDQNAILRKFRDVPRPSDPFAAINGANHRQSRAAEDAYILQAHAIFLNRRDHADIAISSDAAEDALIARYVETGIASGLHSARLKATALFSDVALRLNELYPNILPGLER